MGRRSLQHELLAWLLIPLLLVVCFNVWTTYRNATEAANLITDRTLLASARAIAERINVHDGVVEASIPPSALEMFASGEPDRVVYRVITPSGRLIAGSEEGVVPPEQPNGLAPLYFEGQFRGEPLRAVAIAQPIVAKGNQGNALVAVGQTLKAHDKLVRGLWLKALRDQVLLVAIAASLAAFGLRRGLSPILQLRDDVLAREPEKLEPYSTQLIYSELEPLVQALNDALARVQRLIATQRRFVANAAHQLRTPLALLKTQVAVGLREQTLKSKHETLAATDRAVDGLTRLSNQLLHLARAEQGSSSLRKEAVDFGAIARFALEELAPLALSRNVDLGLEVDAAVAKINGHSTLLKELVVNLAENAVRHTPNGGFVTASVMRRDGDILLRIEDNGPGIDENERDRVFERFFRGSGALGEGTGLGLAIVREIVLSHDGQIELTERLPAPGLVVTVRLPELATNVGS
jgi:two-component system, OmpR family, sensor histidine kinase TctE